MAWERTSTMRSGGEREHKPLTRPTLHWLFSAAGVSEEPRVLGDGVWSVGRSVAADTITVRDPRASRNHARLEVKDRGRRVELRDHSQHGTSVGGERIASRQLEDGDVLRIGDTLLLFRMHAIDAHNAAVEGLLGTAPSMARLRHELLRVAREDASVLVTGERGTGKRRVAEGIHRASGRKGAFVAVGCDAIAEPVTEDYFRAARGGTLFIDEIGDLPGGLQPKLLSALETSTVAPVGASSPVISDVRVIASTQRDLPSEVERGSFLGELYARLAQITLRTPPLRERPEDVLPILRSVLGAKVEHLPVDVVEALLVDPWPSNVHELLAVAKRIGLLGAREGTRELRLFQRRVASASERPRASSDHEALTLPPARPHDAVDRHTPPTREEVLAAIERHQGNIRRTAEELGRSRKQVYRYLELYEVDLAALRDSRLA
jgi:DNA-binding NtrC family response regulator